MSDMLILAPLKQRRCSILNTLKSNAAGVEGRQDKDSVIADPFFLNAGNFQRQRARQGILYEYG
jgi:hypothetical protein